MHLISKFEALETPLVIEPNVETPYGKFSINGTRKLFMQEEYTGAKILVEESHYICGEIEGMQYKWHPNGALAYEGEFNKGRPVGVHKIYFPNGNKRVEITYEDGKINGPIREWYSDGRVFKDGECKNNKLHGMYFEYSSSGGILVACIFDEGALIRRAF